MSGAAWFPAPRYGQAERPLVRSPQSLVSIPIPHPTATVISPGQPAPDFTLLTDQGKPLTLSSLRGRPVVLFFYPKDDTPG
jgi:cytochrome oxidase Cu insertion factor (SCO1/SenC/PrrC family)